MAPSSYEKSINHHMQTTVKPAIQYAFGILAIMAGLVLGIFSGSSLLAKSLFEQLRTPSGRKTLLHGQGRPALKYGKGQSLTTPVPMLPASTQPTSGKAAASNKPMITDLREKAALGPAVPPKGATHVPSAAVPPLNGHATYSSTSTRESKMVSATHKSNGDHLPVAPAPLRMDPTHLPSAPANLPTVPAAIQPHSDPKASVHHEAEPASDYSVTEDEGVSTDMSAPSTPRSGYGTVDPPPKKEKREKKTKKVLKKIKAAFTQA